MPIKDDKLTLDYAEEYSLNQIYASWGTKRLMIKVHPWTSNLKYVVFDFKDEPNTRVELDRFHEAIEYFNNLL